MNDSDQLGSGGSPQFDAELVDLNLFYLMLDRA